MQEMNCLIVEDEMLAADVIADYIRQVPGLYLSGICEDAFAAAEKLHSSAVDIIFLDINLPGLNGLDFIRTLQKTPYIILVTAYHQYALKAFDLNVTDYLLKPVEFSRFLQSVNRVMDRAAVVRSPDADERKHFFFNVERKKVKVYADEILYIEGLKDYIRIYFGSSRLTTKMSISEAVSLLEPHGFIRVHKSYLVNIEKISAYTASMLEIGAAHIAIGRSYTEAVMQRLNQP
jgi:DNA-binding LytR/AlgR family response regulator